MSASAEARLELVVSEGRNRPTHMGRLKEDHAMRGVLLVPAALMFLVVSGCAKQPATMPATAAPAPGASLGLDLSEAGPRPRSPAWVPEARAPRRTAGGAAASATTARPLPRDFMANAAIKDINFDFDKHDIRPVDTKILRRQRRLAQEQPEKPPADRRACRRARDARVQPGARRAARQSGDGLSDRARHPG